MSRSRRPVSGLTLVAPQRPLRRSTRNVAAAHAQVAADPLELLPGPGAVDVEIGAEAQRIDLEAPLLAEALHRREIDERQHVVGLVHEMPAARTHQPRRRPQGRDQAMEILLDLGAVVFVVEIGDENLPVALGDGELHGVDVEMRLHLGQHLVEHEHHEHALLGPFRRLRIDRRVGPRQREHPVRRKRPAQRRDEDARHAAARSVP